MSDIKRRKEEAVKALEPYNKAMREYDEKERYISKLQRKCFWTWPWGHVAKYERGWYNEEYCAVCNKRMS